MAPKKEINSILVVDDDQNIGNMLTKFLRSSGYHCESLSDPVEGMTVLKQRDFELIVSDIKMPGMDGLQLLKASIQAFPEAWRHHYDGIYK